MPKTTSRPTKSEPTPTQPSSAGDNFNLRALIREVAKNSPFANPGQVAEEVAKRIPEDKVREALDQSLRFFVRQVWSEERPHGPIKPLVPVTPSTSPAATASRTAAGPTGAATSTATPAHAQQNIGGPSAKFTGSRKGSEIRDAWQTVLEAKYSTRDGWKTLGDCTYDDLQGMATFLDTQAAQKQARARGWRELAALMTDYEVQILRDLPAEVLMKALGGK